MSLKWEHFFGGQRLCHGTVVWAALEVRGKSCLHVLVIEARAEVGYLLFPQYLSVFSSSPSSCEGMRDSSLFFTELFCFVGFSPAHSLLSCVVTLPSPIIFSAYYTYGFFLFHTFISTWSLYIFHMCSCLPVVFGAYSVFSLNYFMKCQLLTFPLDVINNP